MTMMDGNSGREGSADEEAVSSSYFSTLQQQQQQQQYQRSTGPQRRQKPFRIKRETFLVLITLMIVIGIGCVSNSKTLKTTQAWYASNRDIVLYAGDNIGVGEDDAGSLDGGRDTGTTRHKKNNNNNNNNNTFDAVSTATVTAVTATTATPPILSSSSSSSSTIHQQKQQEVRAIEKEETKEDDGEEKKEVKEEELEVADQRIAKTDNETTTTTRTTAPQAAVVLDEEVTIETELRTTTTSSPSLFPSLSDLTRGQSSAHQNKNITCPEPLRPIYDRIIVNDQQQQQQQHLIPQSIHMLVSSRCVSKEKIRIAKTWMQQFSNYNFYFHDEDAVDSILHHMDWSDEFPQWHKLVNSCGGVRTPTKANTAASSDAMELRLPVWKLFVLYKYGGIFADFDLVPGTKFSDNQKDDDDDDDEDEDEDEDDDDDDVDVDDDDDYSKNHDVVGFDRMNDSGFIIITKTKKLPSIKTKKEDDNNNNKKKNIIDTTKDGKNNNATVEETYHTMTKLLGFKPYHPVVYFTILKTFQTIIELEDIANNENNPNNNNKNHHNLHNNLNPLLLPTIDPNIMLLEGYNKAVSTGHTRGDEWLYQTLHTGVHKTRTELLNDPKEQWNVRIIQLNATTTTAVATVSEELELTKNLVYYYSGNETTTIKTRKKKKDGGKCIDHLYRNDQKQKKRSASVSTSVVGSGQQQKSRRIPTLTQLTRGDEIKNENDINCPYPLVPIFDRIINTPNDNNDSNNATQPHQKIPKNIHLAWIRDNPHILANESRCISQDMDELVQRWKQSFPTYNFYFHDDVAVNYVLDTMDWSQEFPQFSKLLTVCVKYGSAMRVDLWRVLILYAYGGLYSDFDVSPNSKLTEDLIEQDDTFFSLSDFADRPSQWLFASEPYHPILYFTMLEIMKSLLDMTNIARPALVHVTGPLTLNRGYIHAISTGLSGPEPIGSIKAPGIHKTRIGIFHDDDDENEEQKIVRKIKKNGNPSKTSIYVWANKHNEVPYPRLRPGEYMAPITKEQKDQIQQSLTLKARRKKRRETAKKRKEVEEGKPRWITAKERIELEMKTKHWQDHISKEAEAKNVPSGRCIDHLYRYDHQQQEQQLY